MGQQCLCTVYLTTEEQENETLGYDLLNIDDRKVRNSFMQEQLPSSVRKTADKKKSLLMLDVECVDEESSRHATPNCKTGLGELGQPPLLGLNSSSKLLLSSGLNHQEGTQRSKSAQSNRSQGRAQVASSRKSYRGRMLSSNNAPRNISILQNSGRRQHTNSQRQGVNRVAVPRIQVD